MPQRLTLNDVKQMSEAGITAKQAAEVMGVDPRTISRAVNDGTIPAIRLGRKIFIPRLSFIKLLSGDEIAA